MSVPFVMREAPLPIDWDALPSPCYVVDERLLERNLQILNTVQQRTGAKIILALKGFAMFGVFPLIRNYLHGTTASSLNEAILGKREFGGEVHVYAVAYADHEFSELAGMAHHMVFNSLSQWDRFREQACATDGLKCGLRINPEYSEVEVAIYNPCRPGSRFGVRREQLESASLEGLSGFHFHTLCEQGADVLERTLEVVADKFGGLLAGMEWINFGGGHHITRPGYDLDRLCRVIDRFRDRFDLVVYLEPGEAIALGTGYLVSTVLDLPDAGHNVAVLDSSASAHMPDVLEMPYRPMILGGGEPEELAHTYQLGGLTCLAGDVIGDYSFREPLAVGQRLVFTDMAHYTMVKNTLFNGVPLPSIARVDGDGQVEVMRQFGYEDYRNRLS